ncbi:helix-turn-helix domain-containing protein [Paenibacillus sp. BAC0078]
MVKISRGRCRLRYLLKRVNMKQTELSRLSGYNKDDDPTVRKGFSRHQISNWVNNKEFMSYEAAMIVSYLIGCQMEELYERIIEP